MAGKIYRTTDRQVIQQWAKVRNGQPALIPGPDHGAQVEIPCILFSHHYPAAYTTISWDDLFEKLHARNLAFEYQEKTESGDESRFCQFVSADAAGDAMPETPGSPEPLSEATGIYQSESSQTPLAKGTRVFRHADSAAVLSRRLLVRVAVLVTIVLGVIIVLVYWPR